MFNFSHKNSVHNTLKSIKTTPSVVSHSYKNQDMTAISKVFFYAAQRNMAEVFLTTVKVYKDVLKTNAQTQDAVDLKVSTANAVKEIVRRHAEFGACKEVATILGAHNDVLDTVRDELKTFYATKKTFAANYDKLNVALSTTDIFNIM